MMLFLVGSLWAEVHQRGLRTWLEAKVKVMRFHSQLRRSALMTILVLLCAGIGSADSLSYTGTFQQDNDVQLFVLNLTKPSALTAQTWSFGGTPPGVTDAAGQPVAAGGIFPFLTLFDAAGTILETSNQLGCGACRPDPVTGYSYDAYLRSLPLAPGVYTLALTEYDNVPGTMNWYDGLTNSGDPLFTEAYLNYVNSLDPNGILQHAPFLLYSSGEKRTGAWEVDITLTDLPEPASLALVLAGLVLLFVPRILGVRRIR